MKASIVLPAYNAAQYLSEAIESVLSQSYPHFELILIDDGSVDSTLSIMKAFASKDARIKVESHENWGMHRSINHVLPNLDAEWVFRMDGDDLMEPNRLERQLAFIQENPSVRVFSCQGLVINAAGRTFGKLPLSNITTEESYRRWYKDGNPIVLLHPGVAMHRPTILSVGGYREMWPCEDVDLWMRVAEQGHLILVQDEVLMRYRIHESAATLSHWHDMAMNLEWIKASAQARRNNQPEPSREEYLKMRKRQKPWQRLMRWRRTLAQYLDRVAAFHLMQNHIWAALWRYTIVAILQPGFTIRRSLKSGH